MQKENKKKKLVYFDLIHFMYVQANVCKANLTNALFVLFNLFVRKFAHTNNCSKEFLKFE